ncbi:MAG: hypothetical protein ACE3JQ_09870 [Paenisporosarcina sp.]
MPISDWTAFISDSDVNQRFDGGYWRLNSVYQRLGFSYQRLIIVNQRLLCQLAVTTLYVIGFQKQKSFSATAEKHNSSFHYFGDGTFS